MGYNCCVLPIYDYYIELELAKGCIDKASLLQEELIEYRDTRGMEFGNNKILKLYQGKYDEVIEECKKKIGTDTATRFDRQGDILNLILTARAYQLKNDSEKANLNLARAKEAMKTFGIYKQNWLLELWEMGKQ